MRLILHPGHSKCGSTSIQKSLLKNRAALEEKGVLVPDPQMRVKGEKGFNPVGETPRPFFKRVMDASDASELKYRVEEITRFAGASDRTLVISAENLVNRLKSPAGEKVHHALQESFEDVKVIYYIKPIKHFLLSAWQQWGCKKGVSFDRFVINSSKSGNPSYCVAADLFSKVYGKDGLYLNMVDQSLLYKGDLLEDFYNQAGISTKSLDTTSIPANKSLSPALCSLLSRSPHLFESVHDESLKRMIADSVGEKSLALDKTLSEIPEHVFFSIEDAFGSHAEYLSGMFSQDVSPAKILGSHDGLVSRKSENEVLWDLLSVQMELIAGLLKEK